MRRRSVSSSQQSQPQVVIRHNNLRYLLWKLSHLLSLIWVHGKIVYDLTTKLIGFLVRGSRVWMVMSIRLLAFVLLLMPGWLALLKYYIFDSLIIRNIEYGKGARYRNVLDVYLPRPHNPIYGKKEIKYDNGVPVVVFVSGGAWIIGYKLWSALMGREFARRGYVVIVPDYRNFPQGNIEDMIEDLNEALRWTVCNSEMFGGDPKKIVLAGQSAGAHISLCTIIELYENYLKKQQRRDNKTKGKENSQEISVMNSTQQSLSQSQMGQTNTSHFPHIDTAGVLISSLSPLPSCSNCVGNLELDPTDQTDIDQSLASDPSSSSSSPQIPTHDGSGIWWDVDTPKDTQEMRNIRRCDPDAGDDEYNGFINPSSAPEANNSMEVLWDNSNETHEILEPISDGHNSKRYATSPVDDLDDLLDPYSPLLPSPAAPLPLEINLLGATEYASDVINDTAKQNVDESDHDLDITDITLFIGISGPYNMVKLLQHLHFRGLDASLLHHVFNSNVSLYSPVQRLNRLLKSSSSSSTSRPHDCGMGNRSGGAEEDEDENILKQTYNQFYSYLFNVKAPAPAPGASPRLTEKDALPSMKSLKNFPQVALFHGGRDQSIPSTVCDELTEVLKKGDVPVSSVIYPKMSHTDPILENVLAGETYLIDDITQVIEERYASSATTEWEEDEEAKTDRFPSARFKRKTQPPPQQLHEAPVMVSRSLIYFARIMNPF